MYATRDEHFGNARDVRNMFQETVTNQATRLEETGNYTKENMMQITADDIPAR